MWPEESWQAPGGAAPRVDSSPGQGRQAPRAAHLLQRSSRGTSFLSGRQTQPRGAGRDEVTLGGPNAGMFVTHSSGGKLLFQAFHRAWPWHHPDPWGFSGKDQNWVLPGSWSNCTRLAAPRRDVEVGDMVFRCPPRSLSPSLLCIPPSPFRGQAPSPRLSGDNSPLPK